MRICVACIAAFSILVMSSVSVLCIEPPQKLISLSLLLAQYRPIKTLQSTSEKVISKSYVEKKIEPFEVDVILKNTPSIESLKQVTFSEKKKSSISIEAIEKLFHSNVKTMSPQQLDIKKDVKPLTK